MPGIFSALRQNLSLTIPFAIALCLIILHAVYWVLIGSQIEKRALDWFEGLKQDGYDVSYQKFKVGGYPFRFTLFADQPVLSAYDDEGGWTIDLNQIAASAQFYNLNHWIITLGSDANWQKSVNGQPQIYTIKADEARLSLIIKKGKTQRIGATIKDVTLSSQSAPSPKIEEIGTIKLNGYIAEGDVFHLRLLTQKIAVSPDHLSDKIIATFNSKADMISFEARISAWSALAAGRPDKWYRENGQLSVEIAQLIWGPADLKGSGDIMLDEELWPEGHMSMIVTDPNTLITALVQSELVYKEQGQALRLFALMAPRRETGIALPLRLKKGGIFLGPARLGQISSARLQTTEP